MRIDELEEEDRKKELERLRADRMKEEKESNRLDRRREKEGAKAEEFKRAYPMLKSNREFGGNVKHYVSYLKYYFGDCNMKEEEVIPYRSIIHVGADLVLAFLDRYKSQENAMEEIKKFIEEEKLEEERKRVRRHSFTSQIRMFDHIKR